MHPLIRFFIVCSAVVVFAWASQAQAQISVVNSAVTGNLQESQGGGDASFTISNYNNTGGEYLLLAVTAVSGTNSANNSLTIPSSGISVTFGNGGGGSDALTMVAEVGQTDTRYYTSIWVLTDPFAGQADLTFDFNADIASGTTGGAAAWQFGVVSLVNVNEATNGNGIIYNAAMPQNGDLITTADAPGLDANSFFFLSQATINSITIPNYLTPTSAPPNPPPPSGSTVNLFGEDDPAGGGVRSYNALYAELEAADLDINGDLQIIGNGTTRSAASRRAIILDGILIPEPSSAAMLIGAFGLLAFRRFRK
ncbi:MAG: PEP-CTERM sorting domain-containing protein [Verrucomicrobiota bacterium]